MARSSIEYWGPSAWNFVHTVSFAYPEEANDEDKERVYAFLQAFARVLPCKKCREDWQEFMNNNLISSTSVHLTGRSSLSRFLVKAHNHVNKKLNKGIVPYERVQQWYDTSQNLPTNNTTLYLSLFVLSGMVLFLVLKNKTKSKNTKEV